MAWLPMAQEALAEANPWLEPEAFDGPSTATVTEAPKAAPRSSAGAREEGRRRPTRYGMGYEQRLRYYSNRTRGGWGRSAGARGGRGRR